ncbi:MAG: 16S rRNA (adenine(1518)-N(6)/adenine(1519)-N(6))-dimethyltransferase RsmA, partial [Chloroflexi bacterium CFX6]|nr:16S rRNA (adenine(1518)-N(6)/adenine(1519)-N(6))-dimethyltransferase RsmA [Chloroflexi bacterium CFX6]
MDPALIPPRPDNPRDLLRRYGLRPRKGLGQHFLVDPSHLARIVDAAELAPTDAVLEIGPGLGVLTAALARAAGRVVAVEIDPGMRAVLADVLAGLPNVAIVPADILAVEPADVLGLGADAVGRCPGYKVVANLPYHITSAVLRHVLEARVVPERAVVMVQKEVADRILAGPGDMSILAVAVQLYARPSRVSVVPAGAFYPPPKVDSAVLRLDVYPSPPVDVGDVDVFFRVVRAGFGQKRKQLRNSLAGGLGLPAEVAGALLRQAGIDPSRRAETLTLEAWAALART